MSKDQKANSSYIKNIYLPVFNYQFDHGPTDREKTNDFFTGRKEIIRRIQLLFEKSKSDHGAYLVTGYRGMGKTSVVREAFNAKVCMVGNRKACEDKDKVPFRNKHNIEIFNFSLSQDEVRDVDLLRQIGGQLIEYCRPRFEEKRLEDWKVWGTRALCLFGPALTLLFLFSRYSPCVPYCSCGNGWGDVVGYWRDVPELLGGQNGAGFYLFFFGILAFIYTASWSISKSFLIKMLNKGEISKSLLKNKIDIFEKRLYSRITMEDKEEQGLNFGQNNPITLFARSIFRRENDVSGNLKNIQSFELASPKEIESYLFEILYEINKIREQENKEYEDGLRLKEDVTPNFVFIIDELDKIEPDYIFSRSDRESDEYLHHAREPYHIVTKARQRQEAISKLLANLKNFLSDAKAKFIFIGGRDMYDASLADIADRESFYSSIFNEVIYVNSFFKDKQTGNAGLSQLSELFVSQFLLPEIGGFNKENFLNGYVNLIQFRQNLKESLSSNTDDAILALKYRISKMIDRRGILVPKNIDLSSVEVDCEFKELISNINLFQEAKREVAFKIIHLLQNFFIFLTYRSNGSPKKLIELIEKYLVSREAIDENNRDEGYSGKKFRHLNEVIEIVPFYGNDNKDLSNSFEFYLKFSFNSQYEINLTSNYYRPYIIINSKHLKRLGDKLLYSTAFLMDHILKFNKTAFSWRNLEMLPDIILANKDPNFRQFFQDIMQFLSGQHLRETLNAVFQYIFYAKVKNEMAYLSKISELSSAAFNFTLDESFHLKSFYKKKLAAKYQEYQSHQGVNLGEYVHSIGYLHSIIGDLHYYDEEFDDAIIHYTDSVQAIRSILDARQHPSSHKLLLYSRSQLSLGLSLERTRAYDKAYSIYRTLIIQTRGESFGRDDYSKGEDVRQTKWESPYKRMHLFLKPHIALLGVIEKQRMDGITYDNLERNMHEYLSFLKMQGLALFPSSGEGKNRSLFYYDIREDNSYGESRRVGFLGSASENVQDLLKSDRKRIATMIADYYVSVGSLLFFKNQVFYGLLYGRGSKNGDYITTAILAFYHGKKKPATDSICNSKPDDQQSGNDESGNCLNLRGQKSSEDSEIMKNYRPSHASYLYYLHALFAFNSPFVENYVDILAASSTRVKPEELLLTKNKDGDIKKNGSLPPDLFIHLKFVLFYFEQSHYPILNGKQYEALANILTKLGDALLACVNDRPKNFDIIEITNFDSYSMKSTNGRDEIIKKLNKIKSTLGENPKKIGIDLPILIYRLCYDTYYKAGNFYSASFQFKKILFVFRNVVGYFSEAIVLKKASFYDESLAKLGGTILTNLVKITSASNRAQIAKYRLKTNTESSEKEKYTSKIYQNISTAPEVKEVVCLIELIKLKLGKSKLPLTEIGQYHTVSSMYTRIFELKLKSELILNELNIESLFKRNTKKIDEKVEVFKYDFKIENYVSQINGEEESRYNYLVNIIVDALFCNYEMIKILNTYGINYILNYTFKASVHYSMGKFSILFHELQSYYESHFLRKEGYDNPDELFSYFVGKNTELEIDYYYHFEQASIALRKAIELHSEGQVYKSISREMYVLNDDFNDNLTHFCAASERMRINLGQVDSLKQKSEKHICDTMLYQYDKHLP